MGRSTLSRRSAEARRRIIAFVVALAISTSKRSLCLQYQTALGSGSSTAVDEVLCFPITSIRSPLRTGFER